MLSFILYTWGFTLYTLFTLVHNHSMFLWTIQPFIILKSIKWVPGTSGDLVGKKSKLSPCCGSASCRQLNLIHRKGPCFLYTPFIDKKRYFIKILIGVFQRKFFRLQQIFFKKILFLPNNFESQIENIINRL